MLFLVDYSIYSVKTIFVSPDWFIFEVSFVRYQYIELLLIIF